VKGRCAGDHEERAEAGEFGDDLCAVVVAGGLAGGEKNGRVGGGGDGSSVDSSRGEWMA